MKRIPIFITLLLSFLTFSNSYSQDDFPVLEGPYLGQKLPGTTPQVFAPGIVSTELFELFGVFTPDMKEFYFVRYDEDDQPSMIVFKSQNNQWRKSIFGPRVGQPMISPDGKTMHLGRRYMERTGTGWSEIFSLGPPFEDMPIMRLSASSQGTYYFDEAIPDGSGLIRVSRLVDGLLEEPKPLSAEINSGTYNAHPFIAPDESYLIWDSKREGGFGASDLYISFRLQDGSWGTAINLGDKINTSVGEGGGVVTPDGKYFFFGRNGDRFWVDAQLIENLRPKK